MNMVNMATLCKKVAGPDELEGWCGNLRMGSPRAEQVLNQLVEVKVAARQ